MRRLITATLLEYEAALFGACFLSFGAGLLLAELARTWALPLILLGTAMHGWAMFRIHNRKDGPGVETDSPP